jgi:hypothetical protein
MGVTMVDFLQGVEVTAFKRFRDNLVRTAGNPADPVAVMLLEQIALAHLNVGRLHYKSTTAPSLEAARAFGSLAIALTGELRRCALAFQAYQIAGRGVSGTAAARATTPNPEQEAGDGELVSNPEAVDDATIRFEEPASGGGGEAERPEEKRPDAGRPGAAPRGRAG